MPFIWAAFMPHPPVIVPEVGRGRENEAKITLDGVNALLEALKRQGDKGRPDCILLLSPHQPYARGSLFLNSTPRIRGSLARFGAPSAAFDLTAPMEYRASLGAHLRENGVPFVEGQEAVLNSDQGSLVPLYYLKKAYPELPPVILGNAVGLSLDAALRLGKALKTFAGEKSWALVASGDLSHRLTPDAPAGYNPEGKIFDAAVLAAFEAGDPKLLLDLPFKTLEGAGECGLRSAMAFLGLAGGPVEVLSYEGPFGVGYCNALWRAPKVVTVKVSQPVKRKTGETKRPEGGHPYPALARLSVERFLAQGSAAGVDPLAVNPDPALWQDARACFVSIKNKDGSLRGCIGTILPGQKDLGREIIVNAVSAAARDPRFSPMRPAELDSVVFSVDVLSQPEEITDLNQLDPKKWGVILTKGNRRGLLLPDLEGVDSVARQMDIAAQKAGITDFTGVRVDRFSVTRYREGGDRD